MRRTLLALVCLLFVSCDRRDRAIDLELVPSSDLITREDLAANVTTLEYTIDATRGHLYPPGRETTRGYASIEEADDDPQDLELVLRIPFEDAYPWIRINEGSLPEVALSITVRGRNAAGEVYAIGGVRDVAMRSGVADVRVVMSPVALDHPYVSVLRCSASRLLVVFSTPLEKNSVFANGAFVLDPGGAPSGISYEEASSTATLVLPPETIDPGVISYTVKIGAGITSATGVPFDQVPTTPTRELFINTVSNPCP